MQTREICRFNSIVPGWFVEEHDGGIVDQLESDRQTFALASRQVLRASVLCFEQTQNSENLINLKKTTWHYY